MIGSYLFFDSLSTSLQYSLPGSISCLIVGLSQVELIEVRKASACAGAHRRVHLRSNTENGYSSTEDKLPACSQVLGRTHSK